MHRLIFPSLVAAALVGLSLLPAQRTTSLAPTVFAIQNARIVTGLGEVVPKGTVVVRDGLIDAVGADVKTPVDAVVIDGKGRTVYPGFIDAMSAWGFDAAKRQSSGGDAEPIDLAAEALAATRPDNRKGVTPEFLVRSALKSDPELAEAWRRVGVTSHLIAPSGGILVGQSALVGLSDRGPRESVLSGGVAQHLSFRGAAGEGYPRALMGTIAHARQTFLDARHQAELLAAFEQGGKKGKRPLSDPALEALAPALAGKVPVVIEADSRDEIDRALDFAAEFKLKPIVFGGRSAWKVVDRLAKEKVPVLLRLDFTDDKSPLVLATERELPPRARKDRAKQREKEAECATVLAKHGVPFAFATEGMTAERFLGNLRRTIGKDRLTPDQALAALTVSAAKILGVEGQLGGIAKGKAAHLIVADGDWEKPGTRIKQVFVDGVRFDYPEAPKQGGKKDKDKEKVEVPEVKVTDEVASEIEEDRKPSLRTSGNVLLKGATVLPVSGPALPATDILVKDGKIAAIGKDLKVPEGTTVIDLAGMFVMPGIIDTHCHFAVSGGVNEFSLSLVPEVRIADVVNSEDVQIYRALAGGVTTARLLHGSANVIGGQDAVIKLKYGLSARQLLVAGPRGIKFALGENVKRTDGRFPNTRPGVEAVLIRAFTEARDYQRRWDNYRKNPVGPPPRRDLRLEALADVLSGDIGVHCHCYRADEILMLLRVADRYGVRIRSLQHVLEGYKVAPEIARHGASCSPFSDWWAYKWEAADAIPFCAALLFEAGISVCLKSDSNELMRHMYQEAAKLIKYGGMSELEVLRTITLNGARQLGLQNRIGTIEVGKDADLAIFNGHPLNGYARVEMTLVEGEVYFQRARTFTPFAPAASGPTPPTTRVLALPDEERVWLSGATIHPVVGGKIEGGTVEIYKGRIASVEKGAKSPGKGVLDAKGLHLYPGTIDAGSILGLIEVDSAKETRDHAEGGDFQPDLRVGTAINPDSDLIPVTRANGVTTVVTRPTGGVIAGQSALIRLAGWVPKEMTVADPLALHVELPGGPSGIGRGTPFGLASRGVAKKGRDTKLRKLKDLFAQALLHEKARKESADAPANPRLEALLPYAKGERLVIVQASGAGDIREALKLGDELKLKMAISGGIDAWKVAGELKKRNVPVILGPVLSLLSGANDPYDAPYACAAKLHAAGVRFCIRSNGDSNTRNLPYHAAMAVSYGLPPEEGLKAVTLYPAQILGVSDKLGSIEKGKAADLVIANGDILQASTQVLGLYIGGRPYQPTSKHTRLYERYRQRLREVREGKAILGTD